MVSVAETKFKISRAFSTRIKINPKETIAEVIKKRVATLMVKVSAKNKGARKNSNWVKVAEVRELGYGTPAKITNPKTPQKNKAKITLGSNLIIHQL